MKKNTQVWPIINKSSKYKILALSFGCVALGSIMYFMYNTSTIGIKTKVIADKYGYEEVAGKLYQEDIEKITKDFKDGIITSNEMYSKINKTKMITPDEFIQKSNNSDLSKEYNKYQKTVKTNNIVSLSVCAGSFAILLGSSFIASKKQKEFEQAETNHRINHMVTEHVPVIGLDFIVDKTENNTVVDSNYDYVEYSQDYEH